LDVEVCADGSFNYLLYKFKATSLDQTFCAFSVSGVTKRAFKEKGIGSTYEMYIKAKEDY